MTSRRTSVQRGVIPNNWVSHTKVCDA